MARKSALETSASALPHQVEAGAVAVHRGTIASAVGDSTSA